MPFGGEEQWYAVALSPGWAQRLGDADEAASGSNMAALQLLITLLAMAAGLGFLLGRWTASPKAAAAAAASPPVPTPAAPALAAAPITAARQPARTRSVITQSMVTYRREITTPRFSVIHDREQGAWPMD